MSAREDILSRIGTALGRTAICDTDSQPAEVSARLVAARRGTLPLVSGELLDVLQQNMQMVLMSVERVRTLADCVDAVDRYLATIGSQAAESVSVAPALAALDWPAAYISGAATGEELVSVTPCLAAVAETGSVVMASGPTTPATLNFLPETHVIIVHESQVVRHVDDVFPLIRTLSPMPRAVNFVTGPSRTADIEQTLEIGAHGPRRMHVLLVADEAG